MELKSKLGARLFKTAMAIAVSAACGNVLAQAEGSPDEPGVKMGPMTAYPTLGVSFRHDDNIFLAPNEKKSWVTVIAPAVRIVAQSDSGLQFGADLMAEDGRYKDSSDDDYTDQIYALHGGIYGTSMSVNARVQTAKLHDPRTQDSVGGLGVTAPNEYDLNTINGTFTIGGTDSKGRIEFEAGLADREYTNNRLATRTFDRENNEYGATFFWRVAPKTQLLVQLKETEIEYDVQRPTPTTFNLDSKEQRSYVGVKWSATAKTEGTIKVGRLKKDFDAATFQDFSGSSWDIGINWLPRTYSGVKFVSSKQTDESSGFGRALLTKNNQIDWSHSWTHHFTTQLTLGRMDTEYLGVSREDRLTTSGIKFIYNMRRWLELGADFKHTDRNSTLSAFDYKRNVLMFTITGRM